MVRINLVFFVVFFFNLKFLKAADQTKMMQDQMSGAALSMPDDLNKAFKAEKDSLTLSEHKWVLENIEQSLNKLC